MSLKKYWRENTFLWVPFFFFLAITFALFWVNINDYFLADDFWYLLKISKRDWFFTLTQFYSHFDPLPVLFNKIIYSVWGLLPAPYRILLFILHACTCVAVFKVSLKLFELFSGSKDGNADIVKAFICSLFFSVMYIHTENVLYINGHHEAFFTLFFLIAFNFYLAYKQSALHKDKWFCAVFLILALCSKENAFVFILLVVLTELLFFRAKWIVMIKDMYLLAIISAAYLLVRLNVHEEDKLGLMYSTNALQVVTESLKNILFAFTGFIFSLDFMRIKDIYFENGYSVISTFSGLLSSYPVSLGAVIVAIGFYVFIFIKRNKLISFGIMYIFVTVLSFVWLVSYERYLYLPSFGFALIISETLGNLYYSKKAFYKYLAAFLLLCFFAYNIYHTVEKRKYYSTASSISFNGVNEIIRVSSNLPASADVYFRNLPDNYKGAWIFRDGTQYFPELYVNRADLKFHRIYGEDIHTNAGENRFVFDYKNGILELEK